MSYELKTIKNGLRLVTVPLQSTKAITVLVLCKVGSRYENEKVHGGAHFIEHLFFKGTKKRPNTIDISQELDAIGAEFNAFTGKEYTGYYVKSSSDKLETAVDVLSDMLHHSLFDPEELERERGVIIEEINMYHDNPLMHIDDVFEETIFSGNLGRNIAGEIEDIKNMKREDLLDFRGQYYVPENMVVCVAGDVQGKNIEGLIEQYFTQEKQEVGKTFEPCPIQQEKPKVHLEYRDTSQIQMILGFPGYAREDDKRYAAKLLSIILGENMSSRLFISVRERRGLCYMVRSSVDSYTETGNFNVHAGLDKSRLYEALEVIIQELLQAKESGVTEQELKKAKDYIRGKTVLKLEESSAQANYYAAQALLEDEIQTFEEQMKRIDAVTLEDIQQVAKELFDVQKSNLAVIGPFKDEEPFQNIFTSFQGK